ncbi:helix-turn-helix transcriptional regulator [uncultured Tateyamaria sp.]|uniref:ArsR/SmtB family transcription factor n=1 Tax=uncultured Tateyamaria sp. TaxID=455651 RepID=UPI00260FEC4E|nr:metalloregulator ArsR/SmtB family transcription factor [uncultured Tateyamaria sp.]
MAYEESLAALSDPTRRSVFEAVAHSPSSVAVLARNLPVSRPAVSQHLKVLSDAGLVYARAEGTRRIYSVRAEGLAELRAYLDQFWDAVMQGFAEDVQQMESTAHDQSNHQNN